MAKRLASLIFVTIVLAFALLSFSIGRSAALSCAMDESTPLEKLQRADVVFIGTVIAEGQESGNLNGDIFINLTYQVRVDDAVKGVSDKEVTVYVDETWGTRLEKGASYIMLLDEQDDKLVEPLCSTTFVKNDAGDAPSYIMHLDDVRDGSMPSEKPWLKNNKIIFVFASLLSIGLVILIWKRSKTS